MYKNLFASMLILFLGTSLYAQKVGVVLSGGGARGITHVGVIKALEENGIPIDYITGTSMGAVIGSMYVMGYSSDEVIAILKSDDFKRWSTGELDPNYTFYYRNADPKPGMADIHFQINRKDTLSLKSRFFPTNVVSPRQMNFAFIELFSQANAVCGGNFDKLFVPYRCVASDVYAEKAIVYKEGNLGECVRASMTFPFMFKPITIDGRLLFDGGIYNNFPVDIMKSDFQPDFIIGSAVTNNPPKPEEDDLMQQVSNLIISKTDYSIPQADGLLLNFDLENVNLFDFSKVDQLVQMGYDSTVAHIAEIKARVARRVSEVEVQQRREAFRASFPDLKFKNIYVEGVAEHQKLYIQSAFHTKNEVFSMKEFKDGYFQLVSDEKISEIMPQAIFNPSNGLFDLRLKVKAEERLKLSVGGNISSSTSNEAYFGLTYQSLKDLYAQTAYVDAQFGKMYNGFGIGTRLDVPGKNDFYVKLNAVFHRFDYYKGNRLFYVDDRVAESSQYELYSKFSVGMPLTMKGRMEFGLGYGNLTDFYKQNSAGIDRSIFNLGSVFARFEKYSQNNLMYPTAGSNHLLSLQLFGGDEKFRSFNNSLLNSAGNVDLWGQLRAKFDQYYKINKSLVLGTQANLVLSTRDLLSNYTVNLTQAPAFRPTSHSQTVFNPAFSANQFAAFGLKPIYNINDQLHWRNELYVFVPYRSFVATTNNQTVYSDPFTRAEIMVETALVFNFRIATASAFVNYYSTSVSPVNVGVNIGFLLFNKKFME